MSDKTKQRTRALMLKLPGWSYQACLHLRREHPGKSDAEIVAIIAQTAGQAFSDSMARSARKVGVGE